MEIQFFKMNKRNWIESRNSGERGLSPKEASVLSMTTKTVIEQGHSSLISKPWSCCIVLNTWPWGHEPDPSKTQDHDDHGSQGHGHTQPSVSCPTTGDSLSSTPHGYVVTMHLCAKTHQKKCNHWGISPAPASHPLITDTIKLQCLKLISHGPSQDQDRKSPRQTIMCSICWSSSSNCWLVGD